MKKIQIKIDKEARALAIYTSGKLVDFSVPENWYYFHILGNSFRVDNDYDFVAFLNATACETEEELDMFVPVLQNNYPDSWRDAIECARDRIREESDAKIKWSFRSIEMVHKHKLIMFVKRRDGFYYADKTKITNSVNLFLSLIKVAISETKEEIEVLSQMLSIQDLEWKKKAKAIRDCIFDDIDKFLES